MREREALGLSAPSAVLLGGLVAGVLDLAAVLAFWAARDVSALAILRSIATSVLGPEARDGGAVAAVLGLALHFAISFVFAAAYVAVSARMRPLRDRPVVFGLAYGLLAYVIMTFVVVPLSLMETRPWPPPLVNLAASLSIHLFLFGLPIALLASRIGAAAAGARPHEQPR